MKKFPHKPKKDHLMKLVNEEVPHYQERLAKIEEAEANRREIYFQSRYKQAVDIALLQYAFEYPIAEVKRYLDEACNHALKALNLNIVLDAGTYIQFLAIAVIREHSSLKGHLTKLSRNGFTNPNIEDYELRYIAAEIFEHLVAQRFVSAQESLKRAFDEIQQLNIPQMVREDLEPTIHIANAILGSNSSEFDKSIKSRILYRQKICSKTSVKNYPTCLVDIVGLSFIKIAREMGIEVTFESVYLPLELIKE